jgi:hypothetical protein
MLIEPADVEMCQEQTPDTTDQTCCQELLARRLIGRVS